MNLIQIGKYIAKKRKEHDMTQRQLAEKLGMSDKSVSKWERGVCLPDVSIYSDLCQILEISINEFLAGEDIAKENIVKKSEENIIGVTADNKQKQKRLRVITYVFVAISILAVAIIGIIVFQANRPLNEITPVAQNGPEMETAEALANDGEAYIYKYTTCEEYSHLNLYLSEYQSGKLVNKETNKIEFGGTSSLENGEIIIMPDFANYIIKVVVVSEGSTLSTEIPILDDVTDREHYIRSATGIHKKTNIKYDKEQALLAFIYDDKEARVPSVYNFKSEQTGYLAKNDCVYYFSFKFCQ